MKTEIWNGHKIRFVEKDSEWWAVLSDVAKALNLRTDKVVARLEDDNLSKVPIVDSQQRKQDRRANERINYRNERTACYN